MTTNKPYFNTLETQRVLAGLGFSKETKITSEQAKAVHETLEQQIRLFNHLPRTLSRYAATGASVLFKQGINPANNQSNDNVQNENEAPKFKK